MKENKEKKQTEEKDKVKTENRKTKKPNKFIETIKKKWLIDGTKTFVLVIIILAIFFGINIGMQKWDLTPIDLSQEKLFTLTQESKDKIKNIDKEVNLYFIGYAEDDSTLDLAKQYHKTNEKIQVEAVDINDRPDLAQTYGIESGSEGIIVECGERFKVLTASELYTYDTETYDTISVAEEKLTAAIRSTTTDDIPVIYFLSGYSSLSLTNGLQYLDMFLENEVNEIKTVDLLTTGKVPDDCDTLVITSPSKDFDDMTTNAILEYSNSGKNILWLNLATATNLELPNANKILATYGVKPFEAGAIREGDTSRMVSDSPDLIMPKVEYTDITKDLYNSAGVIFINATKINLVEEEELTNLKVVKTDLLQTSEKSYFRTNFQNTNDQVAEGEEMGPFLVGAKLEKTVAEANEETGETQKTAKLIILGENYFASDMQLTQNSQTAVVQYRQNKDLVLNSIAYLADREEDITARKSTGSVTYTATEQQNNIILVIIFGIPILVIIAGIVVWMRRRKRK